MHSSLELLEHFSLNIEEGEKMSPSFCLLTPSPPPPSSTEKGFLLLVGWEESSGNVLLPKDIPDPGLPLDTDFLSLKLCFGLVHTESDSESPIVE